MAGTAYITHRRMQSSADGTHTHVGWVKLLDGRTLSRDDVFLAMARGWSFKTYRKVGPSVASADVIRVRCNRGQHDYLRTDQDRTKLDNLDELPTF
jgi:hypothetical protein